MLGILFALMVYFWILVPVFFVMVIREVYTPVRVRGETYAMRKAPIPGRHEDKRKDVEGDSHLIIDDDGNDPSAQTIAGGAGQIAPIDLSANFDSVTWCSPETFDAAGRCKWVRNLTHRTLEHGVVTNGPFVIGDTFTITGASTGTGTITGVGAGFVQVTITGTALVGGVFTVAAGSKTATLQNAKTKTNNAETPGSDASQNIRRFLQLEFQTEAGVAVVNGAAPDFGYWALGTPLFALQGPNGPGPVP